MELRPMLQVRDVEASSRWYQSAVGLTSGHGGSEYEMLFDGDRFVLQLHRLDAEEHGPLMAMPDGDVRLGTGASLWFEVDSRDALTAVVEQARAAGATVAREPFWNDLAHHMEATLVDPDGYVVVVHSPFEMPGEG